MENLMLKALERVLRTAESPATLLCRPVSDWEASSVPFPIEHRIHKAGRFSKKLASAPPSLADFYARVSRAELYCLEDVVGISIFPASQIRRRSRALHRFTRKMLSEYETNSDFDSLPEWIAGLMPIAEIPYSGDLFVIDTHIRNSEQECPIRFLDHADYYASICDPDNTEIVGENFAEFLETILHDPLPFIGSNWQVRFEGRLWGIDNLEPSI